MFPLVIGTLHPASQDQVRNLPSGADISHFPYQKSQARNISYIPNMSPDLFRIEFNFERGRIEREAFPTRLAMSPVVQRHKHRISTYRINTPWQVILDIGQFNVNKLKRY